jgi:hypothetical protein
LRACDRMDVNPDTSAVREIIDDALNGRRVFAESTEHPRAAYLSARRAKNTKRPPSWVGLFTFW